MTFELDTDAALARDFPAYGLRRGDLVKIVDAHASPEGETGYSAEVFSALGGTSAATAVPESSLKPLQKNALLSVRELTVAR